MHPQQEVALDRPTLREIYRRLPHGRTLFPYFRDRYAFQLLSWAARDVDSLRLLRKGAHGHMLEKPSVRAHLAQLPQDRVPADFFDSYWPGTTRHFRLRVGGWGHDKFWGPRLQTSRPGWNLVLRLDLPASHWRRYVRLVRPDQHWFQMEGHPTTPLPTVTLAWLRIDVDLERGEALIEEIQNDWLRLARDFHQFLLSHPESERGRCVKALSADTTLARWMIYLKEDLVPLERIWDEAALMAALHVLRDELGIRKIWMHSASSAVRLRGGNPPRSLYTKLPRKFGFQRTGDLPRLLAKHPNRRWRKRLTKRPVELFRISLP